MFKSFFPKPGAFFLSAFVWALIAVIFWQAGGGDWVARITGASGQIPISAARFWSLDFLIFYAYYIVCVGLFAFFWFIYSPHRWQYWSILGTALIIFVTWFLVEVGVAVNAWYAPFYDLIQTALSSPHKVTIEQFYREVGVFLGIALIAVVISVLNNFFVSHYVFRWRTAMNEYYMANWQQLRHIEGAAQRVQEDTMRFASTLENMGVSFINAIMTLIAFLPVLVTLSTHVPELPIIGHIPYGLVIAAIVWSLMGTGLLAVVGIKLPGLEFKNQRVEAAYRKELVYGEDDATRATPPTVRELFSAVRQKMPASVKDRDAWAKDLATTFESQGLAPTLENVCSVLAVAQQESNYQADPAVPGLSKIAWQEIDRRAERMHIPAFLVHTALKIKSPNGKSYSERLDSVRTEKQLSAIFDDLISMVPMGQTLFGSLNPVRTGGPMQVSIAFAEQHTKGYPWKMDGTVRQEVFSRRGGLWFGTYHLLNYPASYSAPIYRFADFNAGWYASRNAAFQNAVSKASGVKLALDGDLIRYDSKEPGKTELATRKLEGKLGMSDSEIRRQLEKGDSFSFEETALYKKVYQLAEAKTGKSLPREMLPGIQLESPKITRNLTTAWFAKRVDERRARCMKQ